MCQECETSVGHLVEREQDLEDVAYEVKQRVKDTLTPLFKTAYKHEEKLRKYYKILKENILERQDEILEGSSNAEHYIRRMHQMCKKSAEIISLSDNIFKSVEYDVVERVKEDLTPLFEEQFRNTDTSKRRFGGEPDLDVEQKEQEHRVGEESIYLSESRMVIDSDTEVDFRVLIVGPMGSGKSTVTKALCGKCCSSWCRSKRRNAGRVYA